MVFYPLGEVKFKDDIDFSFPASFCCNCGSKTGVECVEQDTRVTSYLFGGGTEITFRFLLPLCKECFPSAKRRPKNIVHRILVLFVLFGITALALLLGDGFGLTNAIISENFFLISFIVSLSLTITWILLNRPKGKQSSYFQPVRIKQLKREFISGNITKIVFAFSNKKYEREFSMENKNVISKGVVGIGKI